MGLTLESFRNGIQRAPVDVSGTGAKRGFLVYSEAGKDHLRLELKDLEPQSGGEYNVYLRSRLLTAMRDSLSASNRSGDTVNEFLADAAKVLFGPMEGEKGHERYGADKAFQNLECATVQKLLEDFDRKFGGKSNGVDIVQIKRNLKHGPQKSGSQKSGPQKSGGTGSVGTTGSRKAAEAGKPKIDIGEWTVLDIPRDKLTTAQGELRANCPNATPRQQAAVIKLDTEFPCESLGISKSVAKGLKVTGVRPSEIEGFVECHLEGPNGKADVLVDQAGVCSRKGRLSKKQVEADYRAFAAVLDKAGIFNTVGGSLDVAKSFAHSELKIATDLVEVLNGLDDRYDDTCSVVGKCLVVGALVNKLAPALRQLPHALASAGSPEKNVVACWDALKLPKPAPGEKDPELAVKFLDGLKQSMFNDCMNALNLGPNIQADPSFVDDFRTHFMNFSDEDLLDAETGQKVQDARKRIGYQASSAYVKNATNYILNAGTVTGLSYDARLKCISDPHYVPQPQDFFILPKLDYPVGGSLETEFTGLRNSIGGADGRYHNVTFTLNDGKHGSKVWPGLKNVKKGNVDTTFEKFKAKLKSSFKKEQIIQLAHYLNDSALFVTGMGMSASDPNASGTISITKDKNGDMKVEFRRPSLRLRGIDKTCGTITYQTCETTDDYVHRFTIGSDGKGKTDSITLEKNPNRSEDVTLCDDVKVTEGQRKFLDDMAKGKVKIKGLDEPKGLVLNFLSKPDSDGVSAYSFNKVDEDGDPAYLVDVKVDAAGHILGKPEIKKI